MSKSAVTHILSPTKIEAPGTIPKSIEEFIGSVNSGDTGVSIARMTSPGGWTEPGQTPEFDEFSLVFRGALHVETREGTTIVQGGQAIKVPAGTWVRYSTPQSAGAEYVAVCSPAFSEATVNRDEE